MLVCEQERIYELPKDFRVDPPGVALRELLSDKLRNYNIDDVDLFAGERKFSRSEERVDLSTYLTRNTKIHLPLVPSPMPDVIDAHIARVAARRGSFPIFPPTLSPEEGAELIKDHKNAEKGLIENPFKLSPTDSIATALDAPYSNIPIIDNGKLVGIFLSKKYGELFYRESRNRPIHEAMEKDISRVAVNFREIVVGGAPSFQKAEELMRARMLPALAILGDDKSLLMLATMKDAVFKEYYPNATRDKKNRLSVGLAILDNFYDENKERIRLAVDAEVDLFLLYPAHGWNEDVSRMEAFLKRQYPDIDVVGGNDSVGQAVKMHYEMGADGVNIGQGPGSQCTTGHRSVIGVWRPQLSAVYECSAAAKLISEQMNDRPFPVCADGGIGAPYDLFLTLASGASLGMGGKLFAACKDSPAEEVAPGKKLYRAMASPELVKTHASAFHRYDPKTFIPEGGSELLDIGPPCEEFLINFEATLKKIFERVGPRTILELHEQLWLGKTRARLADQTKHRQKEK